MSREAAKRDSRGNVNAVMEGSLGVEIVQQLIPGIPDSIIIFFVAPKLPWPALCKLSTVSRGWQRAIQSRQVYDARVRSQSTQTVVVMNHVNSPVPALYSVSDNSFCHLPQFPINRGELPWRCQCISLDGKVYVLGGLFPRTAFQDPRQSSAAVYVLDLAGQRKWKQCASMQDPRSEFGCGVINGKIYVFGGSRAISLHLVLDDVVLHDVVDGCEVYDPKSDSWSPIAPTRYHAIHPDVITVGEELFVHNGLVVDEDFLNRPNNPDRVTTSTPFLECNKACFAEVYHPLRNQWRIVHHFKKNVYDDHEHLFVAGEKLQKLSTRCIDIYDPFENSWKCSQGLSLRRFLKTRPDTSLRADLSASVVVDDELLALVTWIKFPPDGTADRGIWLLRSDGLGSQNREIVWHKIGRPMPIHHSPGLCTSQL